jgi:hypothetical protein
MTLRARQALSQTELNPRCLSFIYNNSNVDLAANPEEEFTGFTSSVNDHKVSASFPNTPLESWSG